MKKLWSDGKTLEEIESLYPDKAIYNLYEDILCLREDAERYRRLAILVEAGERGVCKGDEDDATDEYMDDKAMMDLHLDSDEVKESEREWAAALNKMKNELPYYYCHFCGIELNDEEVHTVAAGSNYANGEFAPCPECGASNSIERGNIND